MNDRPEIPAEPFNNHRRKRPLPSIDELRETFSYDPETGIITRIKAKRKKALGPLKTYQHGYIVGHHKRTELRAHRIAFAIMTGKWPHMIDHKNTIKDDNRWDNLEEVTNAQNTRRARNVPEDITPEALKERQRASHRTWTTANKEKARAAVRAWQAANPDKARAADRAWRTANPDKARAKGQAWRAANPDKAREHDRAYRARKKAAALAAKEAAAVTEPTADKPDH